MTVEVDQEPSKLSAHQMECMALHKQPTLFNGVYTIEHDGEHRTFRVKRQDDDPDTFASGQQVIQLLIGSDNEANYKTFGFVSNTGIYVFKKLREQSRYWEGYAKLVWTMATQPNENKYLEKGYRLLISRCCYRCNRLLTHPKSIEIGIGPVCAEKMYGIPI